MRAKAEMREGREEVLESLREREGPGAALCARPALNIDIGVAGMAAPGQAGGRR